MCGITGGWWTEAPKDLHERMRRSLEKMKNRGPDDRGIAHYQTAGGDVVLGHTRLSIIDLSAAGHQPKMSEDGRFSMVFNGEIYNYRELRQSLIKLGYGFSSDSDTEVLLAAWQEWSEECLVRLEGMFAFVVYDAQEETLSCARDAFGIKPFFYDFQPGTFLFASEQAALLQLRDEKPRLNWQRCYDYLVYSEHDSRKQSFIERIDHLLPGHWFKLELHDSGTVAQQCWWRPPIAQTSSLTFSQAAEAVREQFLHNIRLHLRSDVPLGAALSGGVDSSAVVCAMRHVQPDMPINTFTFIAPGFKASEEQWADRINQFVGATSHKVSASGEDLARDLDHLIETQGEPFGSTAPYAHFRLCELTKERGVTVTLEGQGADELLAGYAGFPGHRLLSMLEQGQLLNAQRFALNWARWPDRGYRRALMYFAEAALPDAPYRIAHNRVVRRDPKWLNIDMMVDAGVHLSQRRAPHQTSAKGRRVMEQLAVALQSRNLPSMLRYSDRNAMQFSLESRVPFLTLPLANLLLSLPEHYLISDHGETKSVFRAAMRGIVPDDVLNRKDKIGFATPEQKWLLSTASKVREWLQASDQIPFLNRRALLENFDAVVAGKYPFSWQVWRWLNFVRWHEKLGLEE